MIAMDPRRGPKAVIWCGRLRRPQQDLFPELKGVDLEPKEDPLAKPYKCKVCGKYFTKESTLNMHMVRHIQAFSSPFNCKYCQKKFRLRIAMNRHVKLGLCAIYFDHNYCKAKPPENLITFEVQ